MSKVKRIVVFLPLCLVLLLSACVNLLDQSKVSEFAEKELGFTQVFGIAHVPPEIALQFVECEVEVDSEGSGAENVGFLYGQKDGKDTVYFFGKNKSYFRNVKHKNYDNYQDMGNLFVKSFNELRQYASNYWGSKLGNEIYVIYNSYFEEAYPIQLRMFQKDMSDTETILDFVCYPDGRLEMYECAIRADFAYTLVKEII